MCLCICVCWMLGPKKKQKTSVGPIKPCQKHTGCIVGLQVEATAASDLIKLHCQDMAIRVNTKKSVCAVTGKSLEEQTNTMFIFC